MEVLSSSPTETKDLARRLIKLCKGGEVFALYGDLGAGKTTFVKGFVEGLGGEVPAQSPTFIFIRHYKIEAGEPDGGKSEKNPGNEPKVSKIKNINHIDLYRVQTPDEAIDLGVLEVIDDPESVSFIEWPEKLVEKLPKGYKNIWFDYKGETQRSIKTDFEF